jgi:hypothetical protein
VTVVPSNAWPTIMAPLARRAIWLIVLSWLLFALAALASWELYMGAGLWAAYHPQHPDIPIVRAQMHVALAATAIGLLATMFATIAIERSRRMAAATIVLGCWSAILLDGLLYIGLTPSGPQSYDRYAGNQLFRVPWSYRPRGADSPSKSGFFVSVCLDSLRGTYDQACRDSAEVTVLPAENGFDTWEERIWQWKYQLKQIALAGEQGGYQVSTEPDVRYYKCRDADGNLQALVTCKHGACQRQVLAGKRVIDYPLPEPTFVEPHGFAQSPPAADADFSRWDELDQRLAALVNGWAAR